MTETLAMTALALLLWHRGWLVPVLLSSLVMAVLTMLRSPRSVRLGRVMWWTYEKNRMSDRSPTGWHVALIMLVAAASAVASPTSWPAIGLSG